MTHACEEAADMTSIADAVVINIGTLDNNILEAMQQAMSAANQKGIPIVIDAVGVGATKYRNDKIKELLQYKVAVLKGNASEIASTAGIGVSTKGVDSGKVSGDIIQIAKSLAYERGCVVVVTGEKDICTDGSSVVTIKNGSPMMSQIVGMGCMAGSVVGTFCAVEDNYLFASVAGLVCFEIAAENADAMSEGPGTFKVKMFDKIGALSATSIDKMKKLEEIK
ncbi:hydroxyethylthiazole kinase [Endomicrobiia bacterium]|nr:hydroxyethylthiazole kinase [Endomicrobiia bacterium]